MARYDWIIRIHLPLNLFNNTIDAGLKLPFVVKDLWFKKAIDLSDMPLKVFHKTLIVWAFWVITMEFKSYFHIHSNDVRIKRLEFGLRFFWPKIFLVSHECSLDFSQLFIVMNSFIVINFTVIWVTLRTFLISFVILTSRCKLIIIFGK